jgi:hypothetical protein
VANIPAAVAQQPQAAQQLSAEQSQLAGQQALQNQQRQQQQAQQLTGLALNQQQQAASGEAAAAEIALKNQGIATEKTISDKQRQVEDQIFRDQVTFKKDELGRTEYQQEQMMDLALWSAKSKEDYLNRVQVINQEADKELMLLETLYKKIEQAEQQSFVAGESQLDKDSQVRMLEAKRALQTRIDKKKRQAAARGIYGQAGGLVGGIGGGILGGYFGGPAGAVGGAAAGSAFGTAAGENYGMSHY